ncbi:MAG TPA: LysM peptidoglycan-binding domain-containing protein [Anaerolineae bacterium]|nr:LysM peptidoglycan-binding domain-containing protein [Anaerolineae bacterium]
MKSLCTKGIIYFSLALLVVGAAACTQSKPQVPTPTLIPLANDTLVPAGNETQAAPSAGTETPIDNATLVPPPNQTPEAPPAAETPGAEVTPIIVEPTLLPTPTTAGENNQPPPVEQPTATNGGTSSSGACTNPYTVQPGEWFYAIARKCGVSPQELLNANPTLNPNILHPGQVINMPGGGSAGGGGGSPPPSDNGQQAPPPPSTGGCTNPYVVQRGDTLNSIARKCGTTVNALMSSNNIPSPDYIFPGQQITIP